jgi:hypothetical protein
LFFSSTVKVRTSKTIVVLSRRDSSLRGSSRDQLHCSESPLLGLALPSFKPSRHSAGCFCVSVRISSVGVYSWELRIDGGGSQRSSLFRIIQWCCWWCVVADHLGRFLPILSSFSSLSCAARGFGAGGWRSTCWSVILLDQTFLS